MLASDIHIVMVMDMGLVGAAQNKLTVLYPERSVLKLQRQLIDSTANRIAAKGNIKWFTNFKNKHIRLEQIKNSAKHFTHQVRYGFT